jgi:hypothetical protein
MTMSNGVGKVKRELLEQDRRHEQRYARYKREQARVQPERHRHVPHERGLGFRGLGKFNDTVAACRAFVPRTPYRGGQQAPKRMTNERRALVYRMHRIKTSDRWYDFVKVTPRQNRQLRRMDTLDRRDKLRRS